MVPKMVMHSLIDEHYISLMPFVITFDLFVIKLNMLIIQKQIINKKVKEKIKIQLKTSLIFDDPTLRPEKILYPPVTTWPRGSNPLDRTSLTYCI